MDWLIAHIVLGLLFTEGSAFISRVAKRQTKMGVASYLAQVVGWPIFLLIFIGADRKSTRLNSSHRCISYAVFCLKKKKKEEKKEEEQTTE